MIRRRIPFTQIAFVTLIGVGGGVYIYRPYFVNNMKTQVEQNQNVPKKQSDTWLLIILKKNKAELYDGPSELEAKLLRMWDMKFIECWLLNKQLRFFDLRPFYCIFFYSPLYQFGSDILSRCLLNSSYRNVSGGGRKRPPPPGSGKGRLDNRDDVHRFKNWGFSHCCDINLHNCACRLCELWRQYQITLSNDHRCWWLWILIVDPRKC